MIKETITRFAVMTQILALTLSCATSSHRHREGDNTGQSTSMTVEDEKRMTKEVMPKMVKDYPPVKDKQLQRYIRRLGNRIVKANNLGGNPYRYNFTVVDVNYVNAFALPAGTVFVTAPLINMADSETELAGVVGHEIGHILARHTAERIEKAERERPKQILFGAGGAILGGALGYVVGKKLCKKGDKECLAKATLGGGAALAGAGLLIHKYQFMQNSREDEMEADRIGFRTSVKAGFSKDHVGRFYEKLLNMEKKHKGKQGGFMAALSDAMSTHPPSQERVDQMKDMARVEKPSPAAIVTSKSFKAAKRRVKQLMKRKKSKKR